MIGVILLTLGLVIFEVIFREIVLLWHVSILFITVNILFWHKRYKLALVSGFVAALLIDLFMQNHLGATLLSLFLPLLILTGFDNLLHIESKTARIAFSLVGTCCSIFIADILLKLIFWSGSLQISLVFTRLSVSLVCTLLFALVLGNLLQLRDNTSKYI